MTSVIIKRSDDNLNRYRSIEIFIDKKKVIAIANNQEKELEITPGEHTIKPQIGSFGGHELTINVTEGEQKRLILSSAKNSGWYIYSAIMIFVFSALSTKVFQFSTKLLRPSYRSAK